MRGKRSKQYRKLMQQYALTFGFREPYQVLVDAQMVQDALRFKMDLATSLSRTLHGQVKLMISQCSIRHLYALPVTTSPPSQQQRSGPGERTLSSKPLELNTTTQPAITPETKTALLDLSKALELRRCSHHTLPDPLPTLACLSSVLDPKSSGTNKHRLVLACQDDGMRAWARNSVRGVPSVYVKRSVMVMEPMAEGSRREHEGVEKGKLRAGVRKNGARPGVGEKRKRDGAGEEAGGRVGMGQVGGGDASVMMAGGGEGAEPARKRKRTRGPKGPNPLSVKKKKQQKSTAAAGPERASRTGTGASESGRPGETGTKRDEVSPSRHRRRKDGKPAKAGGSSEGGGHGGASAAVSLGAE